METLQSLTNLPINLEELQLYLDHPVSLSNLPENLHTLRILKNDYLYDLSNLPKKLKKIELTDYSEDKFIELLKL